MKSEQPEFHFKNKTRKTKRPFKSTESSLSSFKGEITGFYAWKQLEKVTETQNRFGVAPNEILTGT